MTRSLLDSSIEMEFLVSDENSYFYTIPQFIARFDSRFEQQLTDESYRAYFKQERHTHDS